MVDEVVGDFVFSGLAEEDAGGLPVDLADVVDVVFGDGVLFVYVFGAWAVAAEEDASAAHVFYVVS